jgi:tetratricopeptide (TPR) repeat protein
MLAHSLLSAWQRVLAPRGAAGRPVTDEPAAIHRYDPIDDYSEWARCRDRAQFHLGRARRFKDRGRYRDAAREIERALRYDDTSEAYFQVFGQCSLRDEPRDPAAARWALERAFSLNPRNGYTIQLLLDLYRDLGNLDAARRTLERALAAGAPSAAWRANLDQLRAGRALHTVAV